MSLSLVNQKIHDACINCDPVRLQQDITLIAVSKTHATDKIIPILEQGHMHFGENKVQEASQKWPELKIRFPKTQLHLIGALQTNKVRIAFDLFDVIHTLDRDKLAKKLADLAQEKGFCPHIFIQVNIGNELQKTGVTIDNVDSFITTCRTKYQLPVCGLMAIPPNDTSPQPYFEKLAELAKRNDLSELSMGMSADFEEAIQCGATHIRVGSAVFGERQIV